MERAAPLLPDVADGERRTISGVEEGVLGQQAALARLKQQNMRLRKEVRQLRRQLASYAQRVPPKHMLHDTLCSVTFYHMNEADIRRVQSVVESCSYEPRGANAPLYVDESPSNHKAISSNRIREAGEHEEEEEEEEEEEQATTRSFKTHHKNQETKDEAEEEEQESRYSPFTTHFLRRDLGFQIQKGGFSDASLWLDSVPDYERGYDEPLSLEPICNDNELPLKEEPRCFNCDKPGHTLSECPLPKNRVAISVNRMAYQAQNTRTERYASNQRLGFSSKFAPGILSDELKAALGMEEGSFRRTIHICSDMAILLATLDEEQTESDRTTHRRKRKKLEEPPEEMISLVQSASASSTTGKGRPVKLVEYPGLQNCPLPMLFQDHRQNSVQTTPSYSMHPLPPPQSRPPPPPARASSAHTQQQQVSSAYSAPVKTRLENDEDMDLEEDDLSQFQHESVDKELTSPSPPPPPLPKDEEEQERLAEEEEEEQERLAEKEELERKRQRQVERALRWRQMRSFLLAQEEEEQLQLLAQIQQERQRQQEQKEEEEELYQNAIKSDN